MANLVDFHCHVDLYPEFEKLIGEIERQEIYTLAVTTTPKAWSRNKETCADKKYVRPSLGLHPQLVEERHEEITLWERLLEETRYVGEVGLDAGPRYYRSLDRQRQVFARVLNACAKQGGKIISIHSVRAAAQVLEMLEKHLPPHRGTAVFHWFTGSPSEARRAVELGCYFSINERMAKSPNGAKIIGLIPIDRILTETDGPFTETNGSVNTPIDVRHALPAIASCLAKSAAEVAEIVFGNFKTILTADRPSPGSDAQFE